MEGSGLSRRTIQLSAPQFGIRLSQGYGATSYYRVRSRVTTTKWGLPQAPPAEGNPRHGDEGANGTGREAPQRISRKPSARYAARSTLVSHYYFSWTTAVHGYDEDVVKCL
ncbi:hypothetical protein CCHR01_18558 [Colletotrichum chrysophilum]|uniref:Uncharacterized protein n=1 Tax=Colletotrichum chrysophilum TaxID=1836956 RepID=A0AAD8ZZX1_9PEZI|nr:hypothetical protein CCHR01_18558 [Colletotrichum chrysophilum]